MIIQGLAPDPMLNITRGTTRLLQEIIGNFVYGKISLSIGNLIPPFRCVKIWFLLFFEKLYEKGVGLSKGLLLGISFAIS